jgi:hypothetical protein
MTDKEFCYWLQGFVELGGEPPTKEQWASIKEHLALVFTKVTSPFPQYVPTSPSDVGLQPPYVVTCGVDNTGGVKYSVNDVYC